MVCGSCLPCAPGSKTQRSLTKYKQVQSFWNNSCNYDFYFKVITMAHVLSGWVTQESAKPLEKVLESCLAKLVQPVVALCAWTRLGSKLLCLLCLDFFERMHCIAARFSFQSELVFLLFCWWGHGVGVKQDTTQTWCSCCYGIKGLRIKCKPSVAVMIIRVVELPCLNAGLYYLASFAFCFVSLSLKAFILCLMQVPFREGYHLMELM